MMSLTPKGNNFALSKFESMLKTNSVYFFDSLEFEEIIHYYIDSGKISLAKKAVKLALKQHPNSVVLKLLQAELLIFDDKLNEAVLLLNELQAIEPTNEEIYIQQASIFSKKDDHSNAINSLKLALDYTHDEADVLAMIGMEYLYLDDFDEARLNFAKCLEVDFEDYSSLYNVIYCFDMESKHHEAIEYLNNYIDRDPYCEVAWHQLGRQNFILEKYTEAIRAFDYAILIDESFVGAYLEKAKSLEQVKKFDEAIENYRVTLELDDPTAFAYLRIGKCYEYLNKRASAIENYKNAVHEDPLLDKGWLAISELYIEKKEFEKALFYVNKAIEIDENNCLYWRKYAEINLKINFFEEAVKAFENCIDLKDFDIAIWAGLSDVLCYLGEYSDALEKLKKARNYFNNFAEIEYRLSCVYLELNDIKNGEFHLRKALTIDFDYHHIIKELFPNIFKKEIVKYIIKDFN